jgi:GntR family transcriptional repressor for pyruvate dehydrogenase complex
MTSTVESTGPAPLRGGGSPDGDSQSEHVEFAPVTRETLSAQIRDQLVGRIRSGALQPGDRLPSERALSEQFQVARTSVREAMQGLVSMGLVERRGNRSYVVEHLPDVTIGERDDRAVFIGQLFETRRLLEVPLIELAAERASDAERAEIVGLADRFSDDVSLQEFRQLDHEFHSAIARSCRNPLLVEVYGKVLARLFRSAEIAALLSDDANRTEVAQIIDEATAQHAGLARAIAAGDKELAGREGAAHLASIERSMIDRLV